LEDRTKAEVRNQKAECRSADANWKRLTENGLDQGLEVVLLQEQKRVLLPVLERGLERALLKGLLQALERGLLQKQEQRLLRLQ
jgi:hypothetical protein